jgi:aryl-alcohol dehydrogenase-like predicted oxidoreductase
MMNGTAGKFFPRRPAARFRHLTRGIPAARDDPERRFAMRYKLFGRTGLRVSELCLGTMTFGEEWGWGASREESRRIFDAFAEAGGNFIDTANLYTGGTSEKFTGEFLKGHRERFVLATKYTLCMTPDDPNAGGNHRKNLVQSLEASLKRLGTDYIDLYWVHACDFMTPVEEMMRALDDAVRAGKVLYVGISDAPAWIVSRANTLADLNGWSPFAGLQIQYSLADRTPERDLLPMAKALDIAVTPWGVLGGGVLSGKYKSPKDRPAGARYAKDEAWAEANVTDRNLRIAETAGAVARETGRTPSQVALAWVRQQRYGVIVPILGAKTLAQLKDNLGCLDLTLEPSVMARLDAASRVELGFPHDFLVRARPYVFGKTFPLIDNHRE